MKNFIIILLVTLFALPVCAQTTARIEKELVAATQVVDKYSTYGGNYDEGKSNEANNVLESKLLKYGKLPATLTYKFPKLTKEMHIATSGDGRFRIYTWDRGDGGTMHDYARIYQYKGGDSKVYTKREWTEEDGGDGSFVYDIFSVMKKGEMIYIVCSTSIGDRSDHYQSADLFQIAGGKLDANINLIKTKSGLTNTLGFEYNPWSISDKNGSYELIKFDKKTNTLMIPVVIEDKEYPNGKVTEKTISYRFDGKYFVKVN
jgi:hypothetical protein